MDEYSSPSRMRLFEMPAQKKPEYWQFIRLIANHNCTKPRSELKSSDAEGAYCLKCQRSLYYGLGSTLEVRNHMETKHKQEVDQYRVDHPKANKQKQNLVQLHEQEEEQKTSDKPVAVTEEQQLKYTRLTAAWIAQSMRPFSAVEDRGYVALMKYVSEGIGKFSLQHPSRRQVRKEIIRLADELRTSLKAKILDTCDTYCVTTDMWSDRSMRSFLCLTLHYVDDSFNLQNILLEVEAFRGKHSGERIAEALRRAMKCWGLDVKDCTMLVRDGASNEVVASRELNVDSMQCIAHALHLAVGAAMVAKRRPKKKKQTAVQSGAKRARTQSSAQSNIGVEFESDSEPEDACDDEPETSISESLLPEQVNPSAATDDAQILEDQAVVQNHVVVMEELRDTIYTEIQENATQCLNADRLDAMKKMRKIVQKFRSVAAYFRKSTKALDRLAVFSKENDVLQELVVLLDCPTRWNSTFWMIKRFLVLQPAFVKFYTFIRMPEGLAEFDRQKPPAIEREDWFALKCLHTLLLPFDAVSTYLLKEKEPTISSVFPALRHLEMRLQDTMMFEKNTVTEADTRMTDPIEDVINLVRRGMLDLFLQRFDEPKRRLMWLSFLDPRMVKQLIEDPKIDRAQSRIIDEMQQVVEKRAPSTPTHTEEPEYQADIPTPLKEQNDLHKAMFGDRAAELRPVVPINVEPGSARATCTEELRKYIEDASEVQAKPLDWWRVNGFKYPTLRVLARRWLAVMATSVPSERALSTAGNVLTVKRASLTRARDLVFVAHNFKE